MNHAAENAQAPPNHVALPAPTAWPLVLAFGCALGFAGLVTSFHITFIGVLLAIAGIIGWPVRFCRKNGTKNWSLSRTSWNWRVKAAAWRASG